MDSAFITSQISYNLTNNGNVVISANGLSAALIRACSAYSAYRPVVRRIGSAQVVSTTSSAPTSVIVVGGLFVAGQVVTVDFCGFNEQTATVFSLAPFAAQAGNAAEGIAAQLATLTFSAPLTGIIYEGAVVMPTANSLGQQGLMLVGGRSSYRLPADFTRHEAASFDAAIGIQTSTDRGQGFYDVYPITNQYSGQGYGQRMNYNAPGSGYYPIVGNPYDNPNGAPGQLSGVPGSYRFYITANPYVTMIPAPVVNGFLDFDYYGMHVPASIPANDIDAIVAYGAFVVLNEVASDSNFQGGASVFGISERGDRSAAEYQKMANDQLKIFDERIRFRAILVSG